MIIKLLFKFIVVFLILLIKIGDFVLFLFNSLLKVIKIIFSLPFIGLYNLKIKINKSKNQIIKSIKKNFAISRLFEKNKYKLKKSEIIFKSSKNATVRFQKQFNNIFKFPQKIFKYTAIFIKKIFLFVILIKSFLKILKFVFLIPFLIPAKIFRSLTIFVRKILKIKIRRKRKAEKNHKKKRLSYPFPFLIKFKYFIFGSIFASIFIFIPLLFIIFLQDLPSPKELVFRQIPQTTKIYDRNGVLLYQIYASQNRTLVPLSDIPKNLKNATIAIEDKDFYKHPGFDISSIIRAAIKDISGEDFQGGSTITQQLIKSALLTSETSMTRKVKEIILAFWSERIYSKNQILEMYFNQVPYGGTAWGVEAASEVYFGKPVKELDLAESAFLAGIPRAPTVYSPFGTTPKLWKKRQKEVLKKMADLGYITKDQVVLAENEELSFKTPRMPIYAPHFVMYVKDQLVKKYGLPIVEKGGLIVVTSLDLKMQEKAQKIVTDEVNNNAYLNLTNGAALVTNPGNGDILAMIGSKDFSNPGFGNVNVVTSLRQPGSSIKVVTYSAALSRNFTAATIIDDSPVSFPDGIRSYTPVNYDGKFHGKVPLRLALANSFNIPAVKVLNQIGIPEMIEFGRKMGIKSWDDPSKYGLSITLGGAETTMLELSTVYGVLANGGMQVDLNPFIKITDSKGNVLEEKTEKKWNQILAEEKDSIQNLILTSFGKRVLDEGVAFIISNILSDNFARSWEFGTSSPLNIPGKTVSVKTGTSDNKRDNWTIGYTPDFVVTVWVGNNDNSPMSQSLASGITGAAPIWNKIMTSLLNGKQNSKPAIPLDVVQKQCLGRNEYFIKGTENSVNCNPPQPSPKKKDD